jgi:hypothetical protein
VENEKREFYERGWFTVLMLAIIFPVGLFLMWKYKKFNMVARVIISIAYGLYLIIIFTSPDETTEPGPVVVTENPVAKEVKKPVEVKKEEIIVKEKTKQKENETNKKKDDAVTISYPLLEKRADKYKGEYVTYTGYIEFIKELDERTVIILSLYNEQIGMFDDGMPMFVDIEETTDFFEGSKVVVYGEMRGDFTYQTVEGDNPTIPRVTADLIEPYK